MNTNIRIIDRGIDVLREDGIRVFVESTLHYTLPIKHLREYKYKIKYGSTAPSANDIIENVPIEYIKFTLPSSKCPYQMLSFGVMSGDWDQYKQSIKDSIITKGLRQRFVDGLDWEDTVYYDAAINSFDSKEKFTPLDSYEQSKNGLMCYFEDLDKLFHKLQNSGFKSVDEISYKELPKVHVSRNGAFILTHGHHRTVMCDILGIETIPVRVGVRHAKWQAKRNQILKSSENTYDHPDFRQIDQNHEIVN